VTANHFVNDLIAAQQTAVIPEDFQLRLINGMVSELIKPFPAPAVLRAPTGSGKTFMIARAIESVSQSAPTVWFWFVPFTNLVQQTEDALAANAKHLHPIRLDRGRNQLPENGMVIISTAAAVSRAKSRTQGYDDGIDDFDRSLAQFRELAVSRGLRLGVVIDEAHIGVESQTEFGRFVHWLRPGCLLMATATPKDSKLNDFLGAAGYDGLLTFSVSRDAVVDARLNKRYIEAVIYNLRESLQGITDLQATVLKQAWRRNVRLGRLLTDAGVDVRPLLLVQVGNGADAVKVARETLIKVCGVQPTCIGEHSADDPDPVLMAQIANDTSKDVLIFKQSAGTGFDAPRAFVLASTKPVNDPDFAMQFVGRVMRVHRQIRAVFPTPTTIPEELDSAYIYLANAQAQPGFEAAVRATSDLQSNLQGQSEALTVRQTASGAVHLSNRPEPGARLFYENSVLSRALTQRPGHVDAPNGGTQTRPTSDSSPLFEDPELDLPDEYSAVARRQRAETAKPANSIGEAVANLSGLGVRAYELQRDRFDIPAALKTEERPVLNDMSAATRLASARLNIDDSLKAMALRVATGKVTETEVHKELVSGRVTRKEVAIVIERRALAAAARAAMRELPQFEEADEQIMVEVLTARMTETVEQSLIGTDDDDRPDAREITRLARDCAYWVILRSKHELAEALHASIAEQSRLLDAAPLPDYMLFPQSIALQDSLKNIYGTMPPTHADMEALQYQVPLQVRSMLRPLAMGFDERIWSLAEFDGGHAMGDGEIAFAKALDRAPFVKWWHRNPDRKPYSVRLVRGEHRYHFHPDFVVFVEHYRGDTPLLRLIETKESTKDAANKSKRFSPFYGKVLFLTENKKELFAVNEDGSLGAKIDPDNLDVLREWLRNSRPQE
jgi:superfamily II DNA or RNA helicase